MINQHRYGKGVWMGPRLSQLYGENGYEMNFGRERFQEWHENIRSKEYKDWMIEYNTINKFYIRDTTAEGQRSSKRGSSDCGPTPFYVDTLSYFKHRPKIIKYIGEVVASTGLGFFRHHWDEYDQMKIKATQDSIDAEDMDDSNQENGWASGAKMGEAVKRGRAIDDTVLICGYVSGKHFSENTGGQDSCLGLIYGVMKNLTHKGSQSSTRAMSCEVYGLWTADDQRGKGLGKGLATWFERYVKKLAYSRGIYYMEKADGSEIRPLISFDVWDGKAGDEGKASAFWKACGYHLHGVPGAEVANKQISLKHLSEVSESEYEAELDGQNDPDGGVKAAKEAREDTEARKVEALEAADLRRKKSEETRRKRLKAAMGIKEVGETPAAPSPAAKKKKKVNSSSSPSPPANGESEDIV